MRPVHFMMIYLYMALTDAWPRSSLDLDVPYNRYFPYFCSSHSRLWVSRVIVLDILVEWAHCWLACLCRSGKREHTVSGLEPSGYTVKVESVLIVSLHRRNTWIGLHCTFPMLPYNLSVSIYPLNHQSRPTFTLCSLICLTFNTYSSASASRSIRSTYKDP
jgi:hypothetical protein